MTDQQASEQPGKPIKTAKTERIALHPPDDGKPLVEMFMNPQSRMLNMFGTPFRECDYSNIAYYLARESAHKARIELGERDV